MKKFLFAIGVLVLGLTAAAPAHADFAIVKFNSGYCRIYDNTAWAPPDGTFVWFVWGYHRYYRLPTLPIAPRAQAGALSSLGTCAQRTIEQSRSIALRAGS